MARCAGFRFDRARASQTKLNLLPSRALPSTDTLKPGATTMPVSDDDRTAIKKMDQPARDNYLAEQLKAIREASTGPAITEKGNMTVSRPILARLST